MKVMFGLLGETTARIVSVALFWFILGLSDFETNFF